MVGRVGGCMDGWKYAWVRGWMDICVNAWMDGLSF